MVCLFASVLISASPSWAEGDEHPLFSKGVSTYKTFCSHCHGLNMVNPGTSSYDLRKWPLDRKDDFYNSVNNGKGSMPSWGDLLLPDELDALWVYVATRGGKQALPSVDADEESGVSDDSSSSENSALEADDTKLIESLPLKTVQTGQLRACLQRNGGAVSGWRQDGGIGLDYELVKFIAEKLDLTLDIIWFEGELEEESDPVRENYALLSMQLCDVVAGHPLNEGAMGDPPATRAAPPRWMDQPSDWNPHTHVDLQAVSVSAPYLRVEMGIVYRPDATDNPPMGLSQLDGLRVGIEQGTVAGLLTRHHVSASVLANSKTFVPGPVFLWEMEKGLFDAALVNLPAYDFHLRQNPISTLALSDYRHPLGFNIGLATLASAEGLQQRINVLIDQAGKDGTLATLATKSGLHYAPPIKPWVQSRLNLQQLLALGG